MEALRRTHNQCKRQLINEHVRSTDQILDCGCGRGGDWHKWKSIGYQRLIGVDPDLESLKEAQRRGTEMGMRHVMLVHGDIHDVQTLGPFDVACYNFSIQYILEMLEESCEAIANVVRPGGKLIGITPDFDLITKFKSPDALGNTVKLIDSMHIEVKLTDGPFYADGAREEPIMDKDILADALRPWFTLVEWKPMMATKTGLISDIYSTFVFLRK
jgi:ubiquinone/menaquinone biosynthesis C-methylase UbiE